MRNGWQNEILTFWFEELTAEEWFAGGSELDAKIKDRFSGLYDELKANLDPRSIEDARTALAAIIALDQFPRNIYRGQPAAFGTDNVAIEIARNAVDKGFDHGLSKDEKQFLYMPFMHSEISADQERCVDLFRALDNEDGLKYAIEHRDIVQQFGRFPHRNKALGRETSDAEHKFMEGHAGYGQ
ncbi:DUF924 family protein [Aliihoeflea aestuarii]|jgi:uncharacterized protein (DUF924 family)|uniref:DUF924 family protein n=1 Tax=Aliihoeflea aestuarii TaxID=453840 RepID=UPI002093BE30|nr:DUF924 family protein [Aliihoeflea aestuarii]MCO6389891.1 DUF924 family protein [Aliihoeflea aestuarii]